MPRPVSTRLVSALPRRAVTAAVGVAASARLPAPLRAPLYRAFATSVGADLADVDVPLHEFDTFNAFFARPLREGARPWVAGGSIGSPADGRLDASGRVTAGSMVQAKGLDYPARDLVAGALDDDELASAAYATVYLSPRDYHRVHAPCAGTVTRVIHVGGELWPVNGTSVPFVPRLFCRNERLVFRIERADAPPVALVMVGATVVGQMTTTCEGVELLTDRTRGVASTDGAWPISAGGELGSFLMGSTAIVVAADPDEALTLRPVSGASLRVGESLLVG